MRGLATTLGARCAAESFDPHPRPLPVRERGLESRASVPLIRGASWADCGGPQCVNPVTMRTGRSATAGRRHFRAFSFSRSSSRLASGPCSISRRRARRSAFSSSRPAVVLGVIVVVLILPGFVIIRPNEAIVLTFFGSYLGTVKATGFHWVIPLHLAPARVAPRREFQHQLDQGERCARQPDRDRRRRRLARQGRGERGPQRHRLSQLRRGAERDGGAHPGRRASLTIRTRARRAFAARPSRSRPSSPSSCRSASRSRASR